LLSVEQIGDERITDHSMKRIGLLLYGLCVSAATAAPQMELGNYLNQGSNFLAVGYMSAPMVLDWNNDGKKDLLIGDDDRYVWLYLNQGTDASPSFNGGTRVTSGGSAIRTDDGG